MILLLGRGRLFWPSTYDTPTAMHSKDPHEIIRLMKYERVYICTCENLQASIANAGEVVFCSIVHAIPRKLCV